MITKLTPQQEAQIPIYINNIMQDWSGGYYKRWNDEKARKAVKYIYKLCKFKEPIVLIFDNPLFCQIILQILKNIKFPSLNKNQLGSQLESQLWSQLGSQLESQLENQLRSQLGNQLWSQLESQLWSQLWSQLESQLRSQLESQLESQLRSQLGSQLESQLWSQLESQLESQLRSQLWSQLESQLRSQLESQLRSQLKSQLESQLGSQLWSQLWSQLENQLWSQLESQLGNQLWSQLESQLESQLSKTKIDYTNAFNVWAEPYQDVIYGYYSYLKEELKIKAKINKLFEEFFSLTKIGISSAVFTESVCLISKPPTSIKWNFRKQLHSESSSSVEFENWGLFHWNGVSVPEKLILSPKKVTKEDILKENNAEVRRCYMEKLGAERYYQLVCGGIEVVDEDLDEYQKPMKLLRSKHKDDLLKDYVYILSLTDTSTDRVYNLYPRIDLFPEAKKNVYAARASTFAVKPENYQLISQS